MYPKFSKEILIHLASFWWTITIHKRKSDYSEKGIFSPFSNDCPYPVWHINEWLENSNPPFGVYDFSKGFFEQLWDVFSKSPIPHNIGAGNENCEYTDDCWYSKNCYLTHSVGWCEDCKYIYRNLRLKDCYFCIYSFDSSNSIDLIYCYDCYNIKFAIDSKRCKNSAFLFDCQDCEDCLLCWNMRNKRYCIGNKQLTKEEYETEIIKYNLKSRKVYKDLEKEFSKYIKQSAYWKNLHEDMSEDSIGDYLTSTKDCKNCFFIEECEDSENLLRCFRANKSNNSISIFDGNKVQNTCIAQDNCYNIKNSYNITRSKNLDYCAHCYETEDCFACCGLVGKRFHILNKEYSEEEYKDLKKRIISDLKTKGIYGDFFPAYFSATSYEESLAHIYNPLSLLDQKKLGYRIKTTEDGNKDVHKQVSKLDDELCSTVIGSYWDNKENRPFQITDEDINFYNKIGVAVHDSFYLSRIRKNYSWMFPSLDLRETRCSKSGITIYTTLAKELDSRIVCQEEYDKLIY